MKPIREHFEQQQAPVAGIAKDVHRLKTDGAASADELRQFIGQLQGRSPQEVMGVVAQSDLFRSILLAAAGCAVLLVALTIIPYALRDSPASKVTDGTPTKAAGGSAKQPNRARQSSIAAQSNAAGQSNETAQPDLANAGRSDAASDTSGQIDVSRAAATMGIGDAAAPDSDTKPLDDKLNKLLDGLD